MFQKIMGSAMGVMVALTLACGPAVAGDIMSWHPRTPAGGASPHVLPSLLSQAAAIEFGPEATLNRPMRAKTTDIFVREQPFSFTVDEDGNPIVDHWVSIERHKRETEVIYGDFR